MSRLTGVEDGGMPVETHERLFALRCRSKRGEHLSPDDLQFLESCWKQWPGEYAALSERVREATLPFGAQS